MRVRIDFIEGVAYAGDKEFHSGEALWAHLCSLEPIAIAPPQGPREEHESVEAFLARGGEIKVLPACGTVSPFKAKLDPAALDLEEAIDAFLGL